MAETSWDKDKKKIKVFPSKVPNRNPKPNPAQQLPQRRPLPPLPVPSPVVPLALEIMNKNMTNSIQSISELRN